MMSIACVTGQVVTLGGYPDQWVLVDDQDAERIHVRRLVESEGTYSAGFWTEASLVRDARWPR
ncbi:MAG: hypothetical protein NVS9B1_07460 [Candidatus Dormibacteraceae bacterium]